MWKGSSEVTHPHVIRHGSLRHNDVVLRDRKVVDPGGAHARACRDSCQHCALSALHIFPKHHVALPQLQTQQKTSRGEQLLASGRDRALAAPHQAENNTALPQLQTQKRRANDRTVPLAVVGSKRRAELLTVLELEGAKGTQVTDLSCSWRKYKTRELLTTLALGGSTRHLLRLMNLGND